MTKVVLFLWFLLKVTYSKYIGRLSKKTLTQTVIFSGNLPFMMSQRALRAHWLLFLVNGNQRSQTACGMRVLEETEK